MADSRPTLDLPQLLAGLRAAVRDIEATRTRDSRKVKLGFLKADLKTAQVEIEALAARLDEHRKTYHELQAEASRIEGRDGPPIAADDPAGYRGRPPRLKAEATPLWELGVPVPLANRLVRVGVTSWKQLAPLSFKQLESLPGLGTRTASTLLGLIKQIKANRPDG